MIIETSKHNEPSRPFGGNSGALADTFISSCFVHIRKPDIDMFSLALDIAQAPAEQAIYIDNTPMFVQLAEGLGIRSIPHINYKSTCEQLASFGFSKELGVSHATG
jgi:FMN phosphatase YigB (HAD superfamily)